MRNDKNYEAHHRGPRELCTGGEWIYGRNPVAETLRAYARKRGHIQALLEGFVCDGLLKLHLHDDAAGEVYAEPQAVAEKARSKADEKHQHGYDVGETAFAYEIEITSGFYYGERHVIPR